MSQHLRLSDSPVRRGKRLGSFPFCLAARAFLLVALLAFFPLDVLSQGNSTVVQVDPKEEELEKMIYGSDTYEQHREITYWGVAQLTISDYHHRSGDVEYLKLVVKDESSVLPSDRPRRDIEAHFFKEVKRLFGDLPFHDVKEGWNERLEKFRQKQGKDVEIFEAAEEVRRRDKYGGRAGALYCQVRVKGRYFPVLYDIRCSISAESNLRYVSWDESNNLDFSSPEHIGGKLKTAITEMLKERSSWFAKIRKYTKQ